MADKLYFGCKGIIIREGKVLVLYSDFESGRSWDFPGGRMSHGEDAETTIQREIMEETGLKVTPKYLIDTWNYVRDHDFHVTGVFYHCEAEAGQVVLSDEHDGYAWIPLEKLSEQVHSRVYMKRIRQWIFRATAEGYKISRQEPTPLAIDQLIPNNHYLNQVKLAQVRQASPEVKELMPPVLVAEIDGDYALIDGHSRTFVAYQAGQTHVDAHVMAFEDIPGPSGLYRHIHEASKAQGLTSIDQLADRILKAEDHETLWVGYCKDLMREIEA